MSKQTWKGSALLAPVPPVLVSCGDCDKPNVLTIGWTGIINSHPPKTYISVRPERYSYEIIKNSGEFVINLPTKPLVRTVDFCGVRSGKDIDKFEVCKLTCEKASEVSTPLIAESPVSLECKVFDIVPLGTHDMFLADIVAVDIDERLLDKEGKLHLERCELVAYSHGEYFALGEKLGKFGYSVRKRKTTRHKKG